MFWIYTFGNICFLFIALSKSKSSVMENPSIVRSSTMILRSSTGNYTNGENKGHLRVYECISI
jgi:hypothetical protein